MTKVNNRLPRSFQMSGESFGVHCRVSANDKAAMAKEKAASN